MRKPNHGIKAGYRSGLEKTVSEYLNQLGIDGQYEKHKIIYNQPEKERTYTPDFWLQGKNKTIIVETKGRFTLSDRQKHLFIQQTHPDLDIRFVFNNSNCKLHKGAKSTYGDWCTKNGFKYHDKSIPINWIKEAGIQL